MENLKERIAMLISTKSVTNTVFAEKVGVQPSVISHVLSGRNNASLDLVMKILKRFPEIRTDWLLNGTGQMTKELSLFDMDDPIPKKEVKKSLTQNKEPIAPPVVRTMEPAQAASFEDVEESIEKPVNKDLRGMFEESDFEGKYVQKKDPPKKLHKSIERIVIFYEDQTFKDYRRES